MVTLLVITLFSFTEKTNFSNTIVYKGLELVAIAAMIGAMGSEVAVLIVAGFRSLTGCLRGSRRPVTSLKANTGTVLAKSREERSENKPKVKKVEEEEHFKFRRFDSNAARLDFVNGTRADLKMEKKSEQSCKSSIQENGTENKKKIIHRESTLWSVPQRRPSERNHSGRIFGVGVPRVIKKRGRILSKSSKKFELFRRGNRESENK